MRQALPWPSSHVPHALRSLHGLGKCSACAICMVVGRPRRRRWSTRSATNDMNSSGRVDKAQTRTQRCAFRRAFTHLCAGARRGEDGGDKVDESRFLHLHISSTLAPSSCASHRQQHRWASSTQADTRTLFDDLPGAVAVACLRQQGRWCPDCLHRGHPARPCGMPTPARNRIHGRIRLVAGHTDARCARSWMPRGDNALAAPQCCNNPATTCAFCASRCCAAVCGLLSAQTETTCAADVYMHVL